MRQRITSLGPIERDGGHSTLTSELNFFEFQLSSPSTLHDGQRYEAPAGHGPVKLSTVYCTRTRRRQRWQRVFLRHV